MTKFVCELGFSTAKWMSDEKRGRVVSVYMQRGGAPTLIGDDALNAHGGVSYLRTPQQLIRYYPLFLEKCMKEAGVDYADKVAVGLPAQYWEDQRNIEGGAIDQLVQTLKSDRVKEVMVLPQGLGGIRAYLKNDPAIEPGSILGIDMGFNTIIYTLFDYHRGEVVATDTLWKRGISQMVANYLMPKIVDFTSGKAMTPVEVSQLMENGYFTDGFDRHDIMPEIKLAAREYTDDILVEIMDVVKENVSVSRPLSSVIFFGGGSTHLSDLSSNRVPVMVLPEPEFANALGFMTALEG